MIYSIELWLCGDGNVRASVMTYRVVVWLCGSDGGGGDGNVRVLTAYSIVTFVCVVGDSHASDL